MPAASAIDREATLTNPAVPHRPVASRGDAGAAAPLARRDGRRRDPGARRPCGSAARVGGPARARDRHRPRPRRDRVRARALGPFRQPFHRAARRSPGCRRAAPRRRRRRRRRRSRRSRHFVAAARRPLARIRVLDGRTARHANGPGIGRARRPRTSWRRSTRPRCGTSSRRGARSGSPDGSRARSSANAPSGRSSRRAQLAGLVEAVAGPAARRFRIHPATRTFQALRIAVNHEIEGHSGVRHRSRVAAPPRRPARGHLVPFP